jgi:hypothetical protein
MKPLSFRLLASGVLFSLLLAALSSCSSRGVTTDYVYSELARSAYLDLKSDGYLIGIEKRPRTEVHGPSTKSFAGPRYQLLSEDKSHPQPARKRNHEFSHVTSNNEICLVTHVASFFKSTAVPLDDQEGRSRKFLYNAYADDLSSALNDPEPELAAQEELDAEAGYRPSTIWSRISTKSSRQPRGQVIPTPISW